MRLRAELETVGENQAVSILVADPGFPNDLAAWCESTGHRFVSVVAMYLGQANVNLFI